MKVAAISALASSFPTVEVPWEDLLALQHWTDGRCSDGYVDCMGVVLEIYRRAGLRLPDPCGSGVETFHSLFNEVPAADQLYDLAHVTRNTPHVWVVVRPGLAISSSQGKNVSLSKVGVVARIAGTKFYRLRPECCP